LFFLLLFSSLHYFSISFEICHFSFLKISGSRTTGGSLLVNIDENKIIASDWTEMFDLSPRIEDLGQ
jgi:hypothetical protein